MTAGASVYLVDPDPISRRQMSRLLSEGGLDLWPFLHPSELLDLLPKLRPSIIVLGLSRDSAQGLSLMAALAERELEWPIIAYGAEASIPTVVAAMRLGAIDFLEIPADVRQIELAVTRGRERLERLTATRGRVEEARGRLARLTQREREVAQALLSGSCNKKVAHALGISVRTAEMHRAHLMAKLEVRNIAEAAVLLARAGFADRTDRDGGTVPPRNHAQAGRVRGGAPVPQRWFASAA